MTEQSGDKANTIKGEDWAGEMRSMSRFMPRTIPQT